MEIKVQTGISILDRGFTMVSNLLLDFQEELDISNDEAIFIIKVLRHKDTFKLHDSVLDSTISSKTLQRRRKTLQDKGYLECTIFKSKKEDGTITTEGIIYDFTKLFNALQEIADGLKEKEDKAEKKPVTPNMNIENSYIRDYVQKFEERYKKPYNLSTYEKYTLKHTNEETLRALSRIFDFVDNGGEEFPANMIPRLALFLKVDWRMNQLLEFNKIRDSEEAETKKVELIKEEESNFQGMYLELVGDLQEDFETWLRVNRPGSFRYLKTSLMMNMFDLIEENFREYEMEKRR